MKKITLWIILGLLLLAMGLFTWRVVFYYRAIKSGQPITVGAGHFSSNKITGESNASVVGNLDKLSAPRLGFPGAAVKIVEFVDFTCPFSKESFPVMRELLAKYPDKLSLTIRFFSLGDEAHLGGKEAAIASFCAFSQGKFWEYHDRLFLGQKNFISDDFLNYARQVGLDENLFSACTVSEIVSKTVDEDWQAAAEAGVQGTPTFFVNGEKIEGSIPLKAWEEALGF